MNFAIEVLTKELLDVNGEIRHLEKISDSIQCDVVGEARRLRKSELEKAIDTLKNNYT